MTRAAAAGDTIAAIDPAALLGDWQLTRRLADRRTGQSGTVRGQLTLRSEGDHIAWVEQGTLLWNGSRLPVSRSYRLRRAEEGWWLYFPDGRPFHPWTPGQWVDHPCREDSYRGLITIAGPDRWRTVWEVDGPDKAQRIVTWLSRSTALVSLPAHSIVLATICGCGRSGIRDSADARLRADGRPDRSRPGRSRPGRRWRGPPRAELAGS